MPVEHRHPGYFGISEADAAELATLDYQAAFRLEDTREFKFWWQVVQGREWDDAALRINDQRVSARIAHAKHGTPWPATAPPLPAEPVAALAAAVTPQPEAAPAPEAAEPTVFRVRLREKAPDSPPLAPVLPAELVALDLPRADLAPPPPSEPPPAKRGRGRPKGTKAAPLPEKRKPGRPKGTKSAKAKPAPPPEAASRKRGRPKKVDA